MTELDRAEMRLEAADAVGRDTARGFAGLSTARVVSMILQLVMFAALAGHLGEAGIGLFGFGLAAAQLFDVIANLGFKQVVTRDVSQHPETESWLIPNYLYLRSLLGVVAFATLAGFVFAAGYSAAEREVALIAGTLLLLTAPQATQPILEVRLKMKPIAIADIVEAVLMLSGTLFLITQDAGVTDFLWLYVGTNLVNSLMIVTSSLRTRRSLDWKPRPDRWAGVTRSALVLGIASVFISIYYQIDIALLTRFKPEEDVGNYTAAFQALAAVNVIPAVLSTVLAPVLARTIALSREILQRRYSLVIHLCSLIALPIALGGALTAWRLLPTVPQFSEFGRGGVALSILSVAAGLILVTTIVQATLIAGHLQRKLLAMAIGGAVANLVLNLVAIPTYSLYGAAAATVATEFGVLLWSQRLVRTHLGIVWPVRRTLQLLVPAAAMMAVAVPTYSMPVLAQVGLVGGAYVLTVLLFGAIRFSDVGALVEPGDGVRQLTLSGAGDGREGRTEGRLRTVRDAVGGADEVHIESHQRISIGALIGARLGGARLVLVNRSGQRLGRLERRWLHLLADASDEQPIDDAAGLLFVNEGRLGTGVMGHLTALSSISAGLDARGVAHSVDVIGGPSSLAERTLTREVPILGRFDLDFQPSRWHAVMAVRTRRRVRRHPDPDRLLVVAHTVAIGLVPMLRRVPSYVYVDATIRQWAELGLWRAYRPWSSATLWWSFRQERKIFRAATVIAFSEWAAEGVRAEVPDADIVVLPPGVDTERFCPGDTEQAPGQRPLRILFVGGRFSEKGGHDLIAATAHLRPHEVVLDIVTGDDVPDGPGIDVHRVTAAQPELVELYRSADLFVLPTRADGSPFVILEALATATPVVSTPVGAIPSLVGDAGTIVPEGDVDELRKAIDVLVDDDELRIRLSEKARRRAETQFSVINQGATLARLLEKRPPE